MSDHLASAADPASTMAGMIADLQRDNPQLAMLVQIMQAQGAQAPAGDDSEAAELARRLAEAEALIGTLKRQGRRLFEAHLQATERLDELAAALGACGLCWGDDRACPSCRGRGRPGMVRPDPELRARILGSPHKAPPTSLSPEG